MSTKPPSPVIPTSDARVVRLVRPATHDGVPTNPPPTATVALDIRVSTKQQFLSANPDAQPIHVRQKGERVDWEAMEPYYTEGLISLRQLGLSYGCSAPSILKHANKHGWKRTVLNKARELADEKVAAALIEREQQAQQARQQAQPDQDSTRQPANETANEAGNTDQEGNAEAQTPGVSVANVPRPLATVETYSDVLMKVRMGQHDRFRDVAQLCMEMFDELKEQVAARPLLMELGDLMLSPNEAGIDRLNDMYRKVIEFPGQVRAMKDLADVIGQLTAWETRAFRLDTAPLDGANKKRNLTVRFVDAETPMVERVEPGDGT